MHVFSSPESRLHLVNFLHCGDVSADCLGFGEISDRFDKEKYVIAVINKFGLKIPDQLRIQVL